jgi:hypothetical protein
MPFLPIFGRTSPNPVVLQNLIKSIPSLVAYYPLDETSGNAINQAPATVGTLDGAITGATQGVSGYVGKCYSFDGVGDKITVPDDNALDLTVNFTLFAIVNATSLNNATWIDKGGESAAGYRFGGAASYFALTNTFGPLINNNILYANASNTMAAATWTFIATTYDGSNTRCYKNGVITAGTRVWTTNAIANTNSLVMGGASSGASRDYNGYLQHVGICNAVLSASTLLSIAKAAGF